jgi:hypothetical protein
MAFVKDYFEERDAREAAKADENLPTAQDVKGILK